MQVVDGSGNTVEVSIRDTDDGKVQVYVGDGFVHVCDRYWPAEEFLKGYLLLDDVMPLLPVREDYIESTGRVCHMTGKSCAFDYEMVALDVRIDAWRRPEDVPEMYRAGVYMMTKRAASDAIRDDANKVDGLPPVLWDNGVYSRSKNSLTATKAEYDHACERAAAAAAEMGHGWKPRVWENLGWCWSIYRENVSMHQGRHRPAGGDWIYAQWTCYMNLKTQFMGGGSTPKEAYDEAKKKAAKFVEDMKQQVRRLDVLDRRSTYDHS